MRTVSLTSIPITLPITSVPVGPTCPEGTFCMRKDFCNQFGGTCVTESCSCYPIITTTTTTIRYPTIIPLQATKEIITPCDYTNPSNNCCCKLPSTWTPTTILPTIHPPTTSYTTTTPTPPPTTPTPTTSPIISPTTQTTTTSPLVVAPTPTPVTPAPPSKVGVYIAIGAVAIIALAGLGYYLYSRRKK